MSRRAEALFGHFDVKPSIRYRRSHQRAINGALTPVEGRDRTDCKDSKGNTGNEKKVTSRLISEKNHFPEWETLSEYAGFCCFGPGSLLKLWIAVGLDVTVIVT